MRAARILACAAVPSLAVALIGCGGGQTFTAEEFVRDINREGVRLKLGEPLTTDEEGKELYAVELKPLQPRLDSEGEPVTTGGSISAYDEDDAAEDEYETCRQAADLLCYQLANVVVVLEGGGLETDQLGVAITKLAGEPD